MATLRQILDQTLDLLQHPEFKTFGDLQRSRYQHSKSDEDRDNRRIMYQGGLGNSEEAKAKTKATHQKKVESGEWAECVKKAAEKRANWYKDPENRAKFEEIIKKRDKNKQKKKVNQSSSV